MTDEGADHRQKVPEGRDRRRLNVRWGWVALVLTIAAVAVLFYQNTGAVPLRAFWWEFDIPLVVVVVATAVVTLVIEALVKWILRRRMRRPRHDRKQSIRHIGGRG